MPPLLVDDVKYDYELNMDLCLYLLMIENIFLPERSGVLMLNMFVVVRNVICDHRLRGSRKNRLRNQQERSLGKLIKPNVTNSPVTIM